MKIVIATDHAGFELKNALVEFLKGEGHEVSDLGAHTLDAEDDYPEIMVPVGMEVMKDPENVKGIVIGGSGNGEAIVSNRFPEVRAAVYFGYNLDIVKLSRQHNDANILSLGARFLSIEQAKEAVKLWLSTPFSGEERHARRIAMIDALE